MIASNAVLPLALTLLQASGAISASQPAPATGQEEQANRSSAAPRPAVRRLDADACAAAAALSVQHGGLSLLVRDSGGIAFESYAPGFGGDERHMLVGATACLWSAAAVAAVGDGLFSFDDKVSEALEPWQGQAIKEDITVRQLLGLVSGLDATARPVRDPKTRDYFAAALEVRALDRIGERFRPGPAPYYVFGAYMRAKLASRDEGPLQYLRRRVLDPLGLDSSVFDRDGAGNPIMPTGAYLSTRDWARFGQLWIDAGRLGDEALLRADLLAECLEPAPERKTFGLGFWTLEGLLRGEEASEGDAAAEPEVDAPLLAGLPSDLHYAAGRGGQRLYLVPSRGLVIVRMGIPVGKWPEIEFLRLLFGVAAPTQDQ